MRLLETTRGVSSTFYLAFRRIGHRPRIALFAISLLAGGFALVLPAYAPLQGVLLRGLPVTHGKRILALSTGNGAFSASRPDDFQWLSSRFESVEELAAMRNFNFSVTPEAGVTTVVHGSYITHNLFRTLGVEPEFGRAFDEGDTDPSRPAVALLSHGLWQTRFGGDPEVLGKTISINREPTVIVGIMPPGFGFPIRHQVWGILRFSGRLWAESGVSMIGRAPAAQRTATALETARAELEALLPQLESVNPTPRDSGLPARQVTIKRFIEGWVSRSTIQALQLMLYASLLVFGLACINVAQLRVSELADRSQSLGIQRALGATFGRVVAELLAESVIIAALSWSIGLAVALFVTTLLGRTLLVGSSFDGMFWFDLRLDGASVLLAVALAAIALFAGGVLPSVVGGGGHGIPS